jgi:hypothetical protein
VGVEYNEGRLALGGLPSNLLGDMNLVAPAVEAAAIDNDADLLYRWYKTVGEYDNYWLSDGSILPEGWLDGAVSAEAEALTPGEGIIIHRRHDNGQVRFWVDGVPNERR